MARRVALLLVLLVVLSSCEVLPGGAPVLETTFTVAAGAKHTIAVDLREGRTISGTFSVSGKENFIDFYIKDPNGGLAFGSERAQGGLSFEARAETSGIHTLYFDNSFSFGSPREVTLRYQVR
ncbi:MAG: emp24/gp25L/p24 family protein [Chloroflexi bacterium]|nr:emp24/gp25L/p24 family protein [Chloroflexota bacterium]